MKKVILMILFAFLLTACGQTTGNQQEAAYMNITAQEAKIIMDSQEGFVILDVREQYEYDESHIPGAVLLPLGQVEEKAQDRSEMPFSASFHISHEMIYRQVCGKSVHPGWPHGQQ